MPRDCAVCALVSRSYWVSSSSDNGVLIRYWGFDRTPMSLSSALISSHFALVKYTTCMNRDTPVGELAMVVRYNTGLPLVTTCSDLSSQLVSHHDAATQFNLTFGSTHQASKSIALFLNRGETDVILQAACINHTLSMIDAGLVVRENSTKTQFLYTTVHYG